MKRLIVNADDFGLTSGVNRAVVECHQRGVVTSATLMVNGGAAVEAALLAADNPQLGVGLHLNLTSGPPLMPPGSVPSLVGSDGDFPGLKTALWRLTSGKAKTHELEDEIAAQIDRLIKLGIRPTHIDSHHHLHAHPRLRSLVRKICPRHGITKMRGFRMAARSPKAMAVTFAARLPSAGASMNTPDRFSGIEVMGNRDMAAALRRGLAGDGDTLEFMCHPGYADEELTKVTSYAAPRQAELLRLLSAAFTAAADEAGVRKISFAAL
ncbi:MAG: ChbG/HpnK family deacetylase [Actinobacteria bacterium]|nr:ChbG/HpnK family deacetylase [Actinomycetota bacterium]